jgi:tetratricopeptide (TPR) repeat protein
MKKKKNSTSEKTLKNYISILNHKKPLSQIKFFNPLDYEILLLHQKMPHPNIEFKINEIKQNHLNSIQEALIEEIFFLSNISNRKENQVEIINNAEELINKYPFLFITKLFYFLILQQNNLIEKSKIIEKELLSKEYRNNRILNFFYSHYLEQKNFKKAKEVANKFKNPLTRIDNKFFIFIRKIADYRTSFLIKKNKNKKKSTSEQTLKNYISLFDHMKTLSQINIYYPLDYEILLLHQKIHLPNIELKINELKQNPLNSTQEALIEELIFLSSTYSKQENQKEIINNAEELIKKYPFLFITKLYYFSLLQQNNQIEKSKIIEKELLSKEYRNARILNFFSSYYLEQKNYKKAKEILKNLKDPAERFFSKIYIFISKIANNRMPLFKKNKM